MEFTASDRPRSCAICRRRKPEGLFPRVEDTVPLRIPTCNECLDGLSLLAHQDIRAAARDAFAAKQARTDTEATRKRARIDSDNESGKASASRPRRQRAPRASGKRRKRAAPIPIPEQATCRICDEEKDAIEFVFRRNELPRACFNHLKINSASGAVCRVCITASLASAIDLRGADRVGCLHENCDRIWDVEYVQLYLSKDDFGRFSDQLFHTFVATHKAIAHCPRPECGGSGIIDAQRTGYPQLECGECKARFCVLCSVVWHTDMTCQQFRNQNGIADVGEKALLTSLATESARRCSHCQLAVLKIGGCDHMYCKSTLLRYPPFTHSPLGPHCHQQFNWGLAEEVSAESKITQSTDPSKKPNEDLMQPDSNRQCEADASQKVQHPTMDGLPYLPQTAELMPNRG